MKNVKYLFFPIIIIAVVIYFSLFDKNLSNRLVSVMQDDKLSVVEYILSPDEIVGGANGVEFGHAGRVWVNSGDNYSIVYNKTGDIVKTKDDNGGLVELKVKVPGNLSGLLFSPGHLFSKDAFIFPTREGKVYGWHKGDDGIERLIAIERFANPGSVFTGLTSTESVGSAKLYLADFKQNKIIVLNDKYTRLTNYPDFKTDKVSDEYFIYTVKQHYGNIFVVYNKKDENNNPVNCSGCGAVAVFDEKGNFLKLLQDEGQLHMPLTVAFPDKNIQGHDNVVLIGSGGNGTISIFDIKSGKYLENVKQDKNTDLVIPGLNSLAYGTGNGAGSPNDLFFSSATNPDGAYGKIRFVNNDLLKKELSPESLTERQTLDLESIFKKDIVKYSQIVKEIEKGCVKEDYLACLDERLQSKSNTLNNLLKKTINDLDILVQEFTVNKEGQTFLSDTIESRKNILDLKTDEVVRKTNIECKLRLKTQYYGDTLESAVKLCVYLQLDNLLNTIYLVRSESIRFYVSDGSQITTPVTKEFQKLRDEEEFRADNGY